MTIQAAILSAALALPAPWHPSGKAPETCDQRRERLETIAAAISQETARPPPEWRWSSRDLAFAVLVKAWWESGRFRLDVHEGRRKGDGGAAACLGQVHQTAWVTRAEWLASTGIDLESTRVCVRLIARVLARHQRRCLPEWAGPSVWAMGSVFGAYGTGYTCKADMVWAQRRAWMWWRVRGGG